MELALAIFLVVLATEVINWVGKTVLIDLLFSLYNWKSSTLAHQRALKPEILQAKLELDRTSSQDEFAKWAKLRRKLDKLVADLEKTNASLQSTRTSFASTLSSALWFLTTGIQFILVWWYRKSAVIWLPKGYVAGGLGWWFSFPSAPKGAISSAAWSMICKRTIKSFEEVVKDFLASQPEPIPINPFGSSSGQATPQAFPMLESKQRPAARPAATVAAEPASAPYSPPLDLD